MQTSPTIGALAEALAAAQGEFPAIVKDKTADTGKYKYAYADLATVIEAVRPILAKHKLSVIQSVSTVDGQARVVTCLMHASGEWIESDPVTMGSKTGLPQEVGSALTYARRYSYAGLLGIAPEADDDGNGAQGTGATTATKAKPAAGKLTLGNATKPKTDWTNEPLPPAGDADGKYRDREAVEKLYLLLVQLKVSPKDRVTMLGGDLETGQVDMDHVLVEDYTKAREWAAKKVAESKGVQS